MLSIVMPPFLLFCRWEDTDKDNGGWREIQSLSAAVPDCSRRTSTTSSCRGCRPAPSHYLLIQCKSSEINAWPKVSNSICGPKKILLAGESSIRKKVPQMLLLASFLLPCWRRKNVLNVGGKACYIPRPGVQVRSQQITGRLSERITQRRLNTGCSTGCWYFQGSGCAPVCQPRLYPSTGKYCPQGAPNHSMR